MRCSLPFVVGVVSVVACGGAVAPISEGAEQGGRTDSGSASYDAPAQPLDPRMFACGVDADCLAIPAGGCCPDGSKVAVSIGQVGDYQNAVKCAANNPSPCPPPRTDDKRVAQCIESTSQPGRKCEMVAIDEIWCGGLVGNPHACPRGLICDEPGNDSPGKCVEPRRDCRSTGCNEYNMYCAECAGTFTCRSVHTGC